MPHKLIRKGTFSELHFDPDYDFLSKERDKVRWSPLVTSTSILARLLRFPCWGHSFLFLPLSQSFFRLAALLFIRFRRGARR